MRGATSGSSPRTWAPRDRWSLTSLSQRIRVVSIVGKSSGKPSASPEAYAGGIRTLALLEGELVCARARKQRRHAVIALVTAGLVEDPIVALVLFIQFLLDRPRPRPYRRVLDRHGVLDRLLVDARPSFHEMQVLMGSVEVRLGREVGDVHDQRIAIPPPARVSPPEPDVGRQMRRRRDRDHTLPPLSLPGVVENRNLSARLYDATEPGEVRQRRNHTPL